MQLAIFMNFEAHMLAKYWVMPDMLFKGLAPPKEGPTRACPKCQTSMQRGVIAGGAMGWIPAGGTAFQTEKWVLAHRCPKCDYVELWFERT
jgi:hypothetical protein